MDHLRHLPGQFVKQVTCRICGAPLLGVFSVDGWGNRFCARHLKEYPRCFACQRLITPQLTQGGVRYSDGREICSLCRASAIDTKEQAKVYVERLSDWCTNHQIHFQNLVLKIDLVMLGQLNPGLPSAVNSVEFATGMIFPASRMINGKMTRIVNGISVLKGMPRQMMEGVFVHELGHAWLYLAQVDHLGSQNEEGFCNLLAFLYHSELGTPEAKFYNRTIAENRNPVYGNGFRHVYRFYQKMGLPGLLTYLWSNKRMPA